ncbi:MAG: hypothetical protein U9Q69_05865 [Nanoarchaeota archaeon]|nr:hypothetical protein [Nanoarchaeota archaeon]
MELIEIYKAILLKNKVPIKDKIKKIYNKFHTVADQEILDKDISNAIQHLYAIAWEDIAKISHTNKPNKQEMEQILSELKLNL